LGDTTLLTFGTAKDAEHAMKKKDHAEALRTRRSSRRSTFKDTVNEKNITILHEYLPY